MLAPTVGDTSGGELSPLRRALLALAVSGLLAASVAVGVPSLAREQVESYFHKMRDAERAVYEARQLVVYLGSPQSAAVLDIRSTGDGRFVRAEAGSGVTRLWRHAGKGLIADEDMSLEDSSPPMVPLSVDEILAKYEVSVGEASSVLGVSVVPLELVRRKDRRLVERLWLQPDNGIVYRRELFGSTGTLVGLSTVLEMQWGQSGQPEVPEAGRDSAKARQEGAGDAPRELPYGYRLARAYAVDVDGRDVRHWVYSDGLHALSVFRSRGHLSPPDGFEEVALEGGTLWSGPGPGTWMWQGGRSTWVVVAEEPQLEPATLLEPFPRGGPSTMSRMGAWWARAWQWVLDRFR